MPAAAPPAAGGARSPRHGVASGSASGLAGAVVAGVVTLRKIRRELAAGYDRDLLAERLDNYRRLWPEFAPLSIGKRAALSRDDLQDFSDRLRSWYFEGGG